MTGPNNVSLTLFNLDVTRLASWEDTLRGLSRARGALRARVEDLLQHVHPVERDIIELYYFQGVTQAGISTIIGVSQQAVSHRLRSAFRRLIFLIEQPEITRDQMERDLQLLLADRPKSIEVLCDYALTSSQLATAERLGMTQQRVSEILTSTVAHLDAQLSLDAIVYVVYFKRLLQHKNVYVYQDQRRAVRRRRHQRGKKVNGQRPARNRRGAQQAR